MRNETLRIVKKAIENPQTGINRFIFRFSPKHATGNNPNNPQFAHTINPTIEPYTTSWNGTMEGLTDTSNPYACIGTGADNVFCTKLIQMNGWKIPKDYPFKF